MSRYLQIIKKKFDLRAMKKNLANGKFDYIGCFNFNMIMHEYPECTKEVLQVCREGLLSPTCFWEAYEALGGIVHENPEIAPKVLDIINKGLQGDNVGRDALVPAYKAVDAILKENPKCAAQALKVLEIGLRSEKNDEATLSEAQAVLGNIARIDKIVREEVLHIVLSGKETQPADNLKNNKIWAAANCLLSIKPDEAKAQFPKQSELIDAAYKLRFCDKSEIDGLCDNYSLSDLNKLNVGIYKKAKNAILNFEYLSQKDVDADLDKELILRLNQDWLIPNAAALSLVYGKDFPSYLQKISAYNLSLIHI